GRFEDAEPPARAGPHENHAAAFLERARDDVDADHDPILFTLDRRQHLAILGQHLFDDVGGRLLVDGERGRIDGFSRKGLPLRTHRHAERTSRASRESYYIMTNAHGDRREIDADS